MPPPLPYSFTLTKPLVLSTLGVVLFSVIGAFLKSLRTPELQFLAPVFLGAGLLLVASILLERVSLNAVQLSRRSVLGTVHVPFGELKRVRLSKRGGRLEMCFYTDDGRKPRIKLSTDLFRAADLARVVDTLTTYYQALPIEQADLLSPARLDAVAAETELPRKPHPAFSLLVGGFMLGVGGVIAFPGDSGSPSLPGLLVGLFFAALGLFHLRQAVSGFRAR